MIKFSPIEKSRLMLRALLESIREEGGMPESERIAIADRIEKIADEITEKDRTVAVGELVDMLTHPDDYAASYASKRIILLNAPEADRALVESLKRGNDEVLFALICGLGEKNIRELRAEGENVRDERTPQDREYARAALAFFIRVKKAGTISEEDLRGAEKKLARDEDDEEPLTAAEKMRINEKVVILVNELCRPRMRRDSLQSIGHGKRVVVHAVVVPLRDKTAGMKN